MRANSQYIVWIVCCLILSSGTTYAQKKSNFGKPPKGSSKSKAKGTFETPKANKKRDISWKPTRLEFMLGVGPSGFLGDLGGQNDIGKPLFFDLEPTQTRYAVSTAVRYFLLKQHAVRGALTYAQIRGNDALTTYEKRHYRNIHFKAPVIEAAVHYEFHFLKPKTLQLAGAQTTKLFTGNRFGAYAAGGAGLFFFNSKSEFDGKWYALKPLSTEGQGLPDGPAPYSRFSASFPLGGGVYMLLNRNFTLGLDFGYRWTITDYIDDASGYYYNNDEIESRFGKLSAYFANPSVSLPDVPDREWYLEDQPRGNSESNDTYLFFQVTLSKAFGPSISNRQHKNKTRKDKSARKKKRKFKGKKRGFKLPSFHFGKRKKKFKISTF